MKVFILSICLFISFSVLAQSYQTSPDTTIKAIMSYVEFGGGDVHFSINNPTTECYHGYWLTKNDPGFNANLSMIIAAYQAGTNVVVYGETDKNWAGTATGKYCHLYSLQYR